MAIKLFRKPDAGTYTLIPDMMEIELGSGEERQIEEKSYISHDDDYTDFDVSTSSAPEFSVTFDDPISDLESDYDTKERCGFGLLYTDANTEVLLAKANVTKRSWVRAGSKMRRQYTIKTAGKPVVNTPVQTLLTD